MEHRSDAASEDEATLRLEAARRAYREFHAERFWSHAADYPIDAADVPWVIEQLKEARGSSRLGEGGSAVPLSEFQVGAQGLGDPGANDGHVDDADVSLRRAMSRAVTEEDLE